MADDNSKPKRQPVPAGGDPIPAVIEAADATPPASDAAEGDATDSPEADGGELVEARVLVAFDDHQPNSVIALPAARIEALRLHGSVDPHPDAVAHAKR